MDLHQQVLDAKAPSLSDPQLGGASLADLTQQALLSPRPLITRRIDDGAGRHEAIPGRQEFEYFVVENFITPEFVDALHDYVTFLHRLNRLVHRSVADSSDRTAASWVYYGDLMMESVLENSTEKVGCLIGQDVLPTFSFVHHYRQGDSLKPHRDRRSSEIAISIPLGPKNAPAWPLFVLTWSGPVAIRARPGAAIFLHGRDLLHWRTELQEDYYSVLSLCYVHKTGENAHCVFDFRESLGLPSRGPRPD